MKQRACQVLDRTCSVFSWGRPHRHNGLPSWSRSPSGANGWGRCAFLALALARCLRFVTALGSVEYGRFVYLQMSFIMCLLDVASGPSRASYHSRDIPIKVPARAFAPPFRQRRVRVSGVSHPPQKV